MLEVVNLTKIYKSKVGANVKALDGVSVRFPEKGMVFLLGKSGSGKSTLLNVCGGLDSPTSGEIIVKGRSSKHFSQSDFDSYRNTFVGFIFQEYNILNEFSVEDNIALALELQGKPKNKKAIAELLKQVDLAGYAKRKPNTLSGGQKQRIAIARALVKSPEIIMADEPTGALDSATGKQVFDTLKKLSKDKLVIIVSHDRDFAEQYGDRVIELKDGKIISDVSKTEEEQLSISANVTAVGDTLCVKKGSELSDRDFEEIKAFLRNSDGDVVIASGEKDVKTFKEVSRITDDGKKEVFRDTDEEKIEKKEYKPADSKFIRSRLPIRHAVKIGASGLKTKPLRLIFTVLLSSIAFIMFGLFSTLMLYEKDATLYQSIDDSGLQTLRVTKKYIETQFNQADGEKAYSYKEEKDALLTPTEVQNLTNTFGSETFGAVYLQKGWDSYEKKQMNVDQIDDSNAGDYYSLNLAFASYIPEGNATRNKIIVGNYPQTDKEVCISSYTANSLVAYKFHNVQNTSELIGKTFDLSLNGLSLNGLKISGVFDSNDAILAQKYERFKTPITQPQENDDSLKKQMSTEIEDGLHMLMFVSQATEKQIQANMLQYNNGQQGVFQSLIQYKYSIAYSYNENNSSSGYYLKNSEIPVGHSRYFDSTKSALSDGESLISLNAFENFKNNYYNVCYQNLVQLQPQFTQAIQNYNATNPGLEIPMDNFSSYCDGTVPSPSDYDYQSYQIFLDLVNADENYQTLYNNLKNYTEIFKKNYTFTLREKEYTLDLSNLLNRVVYKNFQFETDQSMEPLTREEALFLVNLFANDLKDATWLTFTGKAMRLDGESTPVNRQSKELRIVGFLFPDEEYSSYIALSENDYAHFKAISDSENPNWHSSRSWKESKYVAPADAYYNTIFTPYNSSLKDDLSIFTYKWGDDDSRLCISNSIANALEMVNGIVDQLSQIFMWIGIVMAVFAALLLCNFITVSISHKKRDIGILRAVGARSLDVFKIFFSESFLIALISIIISLTGCFITCSILNNTISDALSGISLFVFGPISIAILLGVALVTALVATFLPVWNAAKKKPVDSIRAL